jgi:hypothetical protein
MNFDRAVEKYLERREEVFPFISRSTLSPAEHQCYTVGVNMAGCLGCSEKRGAFGQLVFYSHPFTSHD